MKTRAHLTVAVLTLWGSSPVPSQCLRGGKTTAAWWSGPSSASAPCSLSPSCSPLSATPEGRLGRNRRKGRPKRPSRWRWRNKPDVKRSNDHETSTCLDWSADVVRSGRGSRGRGIRMVPLGGFRRLVHSVFSRLLRHHPGGPGLFGPGRPACGADKKGRSRRKTPAG